MTDNGARMTSQTNALPHPSRVRSLGMLACLFLSAACGHTPPPKSQPSQLLERVMPMFSSTSLNGTAIETGGIDAPIVVKFFDAECAACSRTLPAAQRVYAQMPNVVVIGVSEDTAEAEARQAVNKYGLRFPVVVDSDNSIARSFKIEHTPMTFVADRQGRIRWVGGENVTEAVLMAAVESVDD
jgi:peroxiredoxin